MNSYAVVVSDEEHDALRRLAACSNEADGRKPSAGDLAALNELAGRLVKLDDARGFEHVVLTTGEVARLQAIAEALSATSGASPEFDADLLEEIAHRHRIVARPASPDQPAIGERAWLSRYLGPEAREALVTACMILTDDLIDSVCQSRPGQPFTATEFGARLPVRPYPADFPRRLLACQFQMVGKLAAQTEPQPSCVAEEVCAYLICVYARELAEDPDSPWHSEAGAYELEVFDVLEDTDFLLLWDPTATPPPVEGWTIAPDAPIEEWFAPFSPSRGEVHPYASGAKPRRG